VIEGMAYGRRRENWDATAHLLAKIHNVNCTRGCDVMAPADFHPIRRGRLGGHGAVQTSGEFHRAMADALEKEGAV